MPIISAAIDMIVPSGFVASAQEDSGEDVLELDGNKSEDNWWETLHCNYACSMFLLSFSYFIVYDCTT